MYDFATVGLHIVYCVFSHVNGPAVRGKHCESKICISTVSFLFMASAIMCIFVISITFIYVFSISKTC